MEKMGCHENVCQRERAYLRREKEFARDEKCRYGKEEGSVVLGLLAGMEQTGGSSYLNFPSPPIRRK